MNLLDQIRSRLQNYTGPDQMQSMRMLYGADPAQQSSLMGAMKGGFQPFNQGMPDTQFKVDNTHTGDEGTSLPLHYPLPNFGAPQIQQPPAQTAPQQSQGPDIGTILKIMSMFGGA